MEENKKYPKYPAWKEIEKENQQAEPAVFLEIRNASGNVVNRVMGDTKKGLHRVTWDMTHANSSAIEMVAEKKDDDENEDSEDSGLIAMPGIYTATLYKRVDGEMSQLTDAVQFELRAIHQPAIAGPSPEAVHAFNEKLIAAERQSSAANAVLKQLTKAMATLRAAIDKTPGDITNLETQYAAIQTKINAINFELNGLESRDRMGIKPANISTRLWYAMSATWSSYGPTAQHREQFDHAIQGLNAVSKRLKLLQESTLPSLQQAVIKAGGPWTVGSPVISD